MSSEMSLEALYTEFQRREIVLQMDGSKLVALDPYQRLSPSLDASIRAHRDELVAALKPVSAALGPLQETVDKALVGTDLGPVMEATDLAFQRGEITQEEAEALAPAATEKSRQIPTCVEEMPPEDSEKYQMVPTDQLLGSHAFGPGKTCWACGGQDWWDKAEQPTCSICHPSPWK